jgi:hypothetical protein
MPRQEGSLSWQAAEAAILDATYSRTYAYSYTARVWPYKPLSDASAWTLGQCYTLGGGKHVTAPLKTGPKDVRQAL